MIFCKQQLQCGHDGVDNNNRLPRHINRHYPLIATTPHSSFHTRNNNLIRKSYHEVLPEVLSFSPELPTTVRSLSI